MTSPADPTRDAGPSAVVVGAGPAGLAASVEAAAAGVQVTVLDAGARTGGQYWRHGPAGVAADADLHHDVAIHELLAARFDALVAEGRITHRPQHDVWTLQVRDDDGHAPGGGTGGGGVTVHAVDRTDPLRPAEVRVDADLLVLAVGAYDRQVPFPGWDLPGVMTVGAAQSLLKASGVVVGPRVLVAGTGPFLLPVATGLAARGATVLGVHEANHPLRWLGHLPALASQRAKLGEAAGYAAVLARHRVPVHHRSVVLAAHGTDRLEAVTVARVDRAGVVRPATRRRVRVDVLAVGHGFTAQSELPLAAGAALHTTADGTLAVTVDDRQATSHPRVFAAGESTGVGGAQLAVAEGTLAGAAVARALGLSPDLDPHGLRALAARRDALRRFAAAMHAVYPVPPAWLEALTPDTIVCRCEEVSVAEIDDAIAFGARDTRTVKLLSRSGMGWCQGRECAYATACLLAHRTGREPDLTSGAARPVASPITLGLVAAGADPP